MKATKEMLEMTINKRTQEVSKLAWEFSKNKGEKFEYETIKGIVILVTKKLIELNLLLRAYKLESEECRVPDNRALPDNRTYACPLCPYKLESE